MKLSIAALACATQLPLYGRPATNSRLVDASRESWAWSERSCNNEQVQRDIKNVCRHPGASNQREMECDSCGWWGGDEIYTCTVPCCALGRVDGTTCGCMHNGENFKIGHFEKAINNAVKCCAIDIHHNPRWVGDKCGCTDVNATPKFGAVEGDCCSGTWDENKKCKKAQPKASNPGMRPQDCITGRLADDGSCKEGEPGEPVIDPTHCMSGEADDFGNCLCVHAGTAHDNPEACCSGHHEEGSKICACMPSEWNLHNGANNLDCCSQMEAGGVCQCQRGGGPIKKGWGLGGCCAEHEIEHHDHAHCGCYKPGSNISFLRASACCGGFYNRTAGTCSCIPNGFMVAGFVTKESCCSGHIEHGEHSGGHCAGEPEPQAVEPEPIEPVGPVIQPTQRPLGR